MEDTLFVVNPVSAKGLTGKQWPDLKEQLEKELSSPIKDILTETESLVSKIVRNALKESIKTIVSVGGDGTHSQVIKGFFAEDNLTQPINPAANLVFMSRGTGGDLCRHFKLGKGIEFVINSLRGVESPLDVGLIQYVDFDNQKQERQFINISSVGLSADTAMRMKKLKKSSAINYLTTTLKSALGFKGKVAKVFIDDKLFYEGKVFLVTLANGSYFGGGMYVAPKAITSDGLFDVVILTELTKTQLFTKISKVYSGKHLGLKQVLYAQGSKVKIETEEDLPLEIDGDPLGKAPIEASILPSALKVRLPKNSD